MSACSIPFAFSPDPYSDDCPTQSDMIDKANRWNTTQDSRAFLNGQYSCEQRKLLPRWPPRSPLRPKNQNSMYTFPTGIPMDDINGYSDFIAPYYQNDNQTSGTTAAAVDPAPADSQPSSVSPPPMDSYIPPPSIGVITSTDPVLPGQMDSYVPVDFMQESVESDAQPAENKDVTEQAMSGMRVDDNEEDDDDQLETTYSNGDCSRQKRKDNTLLLLFLIVLSILVLVLAVKYFMYVFQT